MTEGKHLQTPQSFCECCKCHWPGSSRCLKLLSHCMFSRGCKVCMAYGVCWAQDHSPFEPLLFCLQGIVTSLFVTYGLGQGSSGIWAPLPVLGLDKTQAAACQAMCQWWQGLPSAELGGNSVSMLDQAWATSEQRWHVVLNYTCIFFVILYELLFGETGVRPPALAHWGGQRLAMFLAKRQSVFCQVSLSPLSPLPHAALAWNG